MCTSSFFKKQLPGALLLITILFLALACSKSLVISKNAYELRDGYPLKYSLTQAKNATERKLLVLLPDAIDSTQWEKSSLVKYLFDKNYQVLLPQVKGVDYTQQQVLDQYEGRLESIRELLGALHNNNAIDTSTHVVVLGMGDGAYLTPQLAQSVKANAFILVNNGPYSFIHELELLLEGDTTQRKVSYLKEVSLLNVPELNTLFTEIRNGTPTMKSFLGRTSGSWKAYSTVKLGEAVFYNRIPALQLYEPNYPFVADSAAYRFAQFTGTRYPKIDTLSLQTPLFKRAPLDSTLLKKLNYILSTR